MQNEAPVVVYLAALIIHLDANHVPLIVHLVAAITRVVLVEASVDALIPTIALVIAYQDSVATGIIGFLESLVVLLNPDVFALAAHLVSSIGSIYLVQPVIDSQVAAIPLARAHKRRVGAAIVNSLEKLVVLLVMDARPSWSDTLPALRQICA